MKNLHTLRKQLVPINQQLISSILARKEQVKKIQHLKVNKDNTYKNFDPKQEILVFKSLHDSLKQFSLRELFAFSLLVEEHASSETLSYPCWSHGVHLSQERVSLKIQHMINPILLAVIHKDLYDQLVLNKEFNNILSSLEL